MDRRTKEPDCVTALRNRDHPELVRGPAKRVACAERNAEVSKQNGLKLFQDLRDSVIYTLDQMEEMKKEFWSAVADVKTARAAASLTPSTPVNEHRVNVLEKRLAKLDLRLSALVVKISGQADEVPCYPED